MPHVGNDIVDLTHPDAQGKSRNTRFIRRVFTPDEQERITHARCPDAMLWLLWSGKETAYKIVSKINPGASSAPRLYGVRYEGEAEEAITGPGNYFPGTVSTPCGNVSIRSFVNHDYIHCIGVAGSPADIHDVVCAVEPITRYGKSGVDYESLYVREAAGKCLASYLHVEPAEIDIRRMGDSSRLGPPLVYCRGSRAGIDISLSHDGPFSAYAFARYDLT